MELKNPFALRSGVIITIADLTPNERGRNCKCICPECKGHFIAVMGKIRQPHFRHDGEPCDSVKALMTALYRLLSEAINERPCFAFPACYGLYYGIPVQRQATIEDVRAAVELMDNDFEDTELIIKAKTFGVEKYEIHRNTKGIPDAILLTDNVKHHQLAVSLVPPPTFCKISEPKPFQDIPTIAIHMGADFDLHHMKSDEVKIRLRDKADDKKWISSPAIEAWLLKNLARQHEYYEEHLAEEQTRKQALAKENAGREKIHAKAMLLQDEQQKADNAQITHLHQIMTEYRNRKQIEHPLSALQLASEELQKISQMLEAKYPIIPNEMVVDDVGRRWCFCDTCHCWKPDVFMASYGGTGDRVNCGLCSECSRKQS